VITTLLLDLDDTLLGNSDEIFIPTYFEKLSRHLSAVVPKERMLTHLIAGTSAMLENEDPAFHLKEVFDRVFYPGIQLSAEQILPLSEEFYATEFPKLAPLTKRIPISKDLVEYAISNDLEVVIATNPLYPRTATEQRLDWAGLSVDQYEFAIVTTYENSHFAKPHLEYYAEILAKLGRNPHDAVMIGNDLSDDIEPARTLGIASFHISDEPSINAPSGSISDALDWLKRNPDILDPRTAAVPQSLSARLMGNLVAFDNLPGDLNEDVWIEKPNPESWAAIEVITHLRDVELEINYPRIKSILLSDEPFLSAFDSDRWAEERAYINNNPTEVLQSLWQARRNTISLLANEGPEAWERNARHAIFGPTTLSELVLIFIEHDLLHLRQLRTILSQN
jgi:FMN phosphatase YigB (HAD superfamily)